MKLTTKIFAFLVMVTFIAIPGFAQTGNISGKVVDADGKPMTGVTMSIDRVGVTQHFEVKTDNKGQYLHAGLPTGGYKVSVIKEGKTLMTNENVRVTFGGDSKTDFDLKNAKAAAGGATDEERKKIAEEKAKADATKASFEGARAALAAKNYDEAIRLFKEASEKDPTQHVIFANLADAYSQAKKYDDSAAAYKIELKPDESAYYNNLGIALGNGGKIDEATQNLQKAAELNPAGAGQSYYNLGAVLTNKGRTKEAGDAFKKAIEFNPQMASAYYQLGISYFGNTATIGDAVPALEKFLQLQPTGPDAEAAKQLIEAAKAAAPTGFKSEKAIAEEKAAAEAKAKADTAKAKKKN